MGPYKIDHVGIAVRSIEDALPFYTGLLELAAECEEIIESQAVRAVFVPVGPSMIELLEPTSPNSPIAKFLDKRGPGLHHIAYLVSDVNQALLEARQKGYWLIDERARPGGHGKLIAFLHPAGAGGVLTEFCQAAGNGSASS